MVNKKRNEGTNMDEFSILNSDFAYSLTEIVSSSSLVIQSTPSLTLSTGQHRRSSTETSTSDKTVYSGEIQQLTPFLIRQSHLLAVVYTRFYHRPTMRLSAQLPNSTSVVSRLALNVPCQPAL
jgi:hypothetical protein